MAEKEISMLTFKCLLIGYYGPVKHVFLEQLREDGFSKSEVNAEDIEVHSVVFGTTRGPIRFSVWDVDYENIYQKLDEGNRVKADCAFLMFDDAANDHVELRKAYEFVPTVLCGTKADLEDVSKEKTKLEYNYNIELRNKYSFVYPFLWIATQLLGDNHLHFVPMPAVNPTHRKEDQEMPLQLQRDLELAMKTPLPPDDDE